MASQPLVTWKDANGKSKDPYDGAPTTDVHMRGIPVIRVTTKPKATRRGKAARRRANSRVRTNRASIPFLAD